MSNKTMPDRIWITGENSMWPTFRSFIASDLDHSNDDGTSDYQEYVRADLVPALAVPDDAAGPHTCMVCKQHVSFCGCEGEDFRETIEAQAAELARYREALGPFAAVAEHDIGDDETDGEAFRPMQFLNRAPKLTVGDLRRARAALTQPTGDRT